MTTDPERYIADQRDDDDEDVMATPLLHEQTRALETICDDTLQITKEVQKMLDSIPPSKMT